MSTVAQRYGADGDYAGSDRVPGTPHPDEYGYGSYTGDGPGAHDVPAGGADAWTGWAEEPPPISGALVHQHRTLPHGELRADFGAHLETHYPRLVAQLYAITLHPQDAHDAVQDAYSRAWRRWRVLRGSGPGDAGPGRSGHEDAAVGWVRRVAIRTSMRGRFLRFGRRRRPSPEETDPRTGALLEALGRLAPADRRAVVLHHMAGLPTAAVAELEEVTEQEVRRRLARGREIVTEGMAEVLEEIVGAPGAPQDGGFTRAVEGGRA
ncbi:RNA polymerase sigma-70 factor, ECF subfamily [Pseudonocardia ammonioxydans]|uniref:RNA polymerase sigma-70 factor, ECF subfamily n=1 Tax=Pseudonocardia ammonioxydans TaxID=260086 RepID=A0A1I4VGG4_PSUAM|nr:RNA polymerase sigma-70 factor, ECF subfamily [Pseudonocardia ammonioxydans]